MEEIEDLREYTSMNYCLNEIPRRVRKGLGIVEVQFLCIDAVEEYIAVGTNIGVVYWCNRIKNKIERLRPERYGPKITFVKVISSVDYMVAVGDASGVVSIFMIPKEKLPFLPTDGGKFLRKSIERFSVFDIHTSAITSIEWSLNGQKLFTGDEKGLIVYTQVDFNLNIIKSSEILNEKFPIVQLSYCQPQLLLVASEYRCIIYNQTKEQQIFQVGQKDRLNLCKLGGILFCRLPSVGPVIYAARPKQRIWLADTEGCVQQTYLFKEAILRSQKVIKLINDSGAVSKNPNDVHSQESLSNSYTEEYSTSSCFSSTSFSEMEFSRLKIYKNKFLLAYNSDALVLLNLEETSVVASLYAVRKILSVAVNKDEIFVLDGYRRVRRMATIKDRYNFAKPNNKEAKDSVIGDFLTLMNNIKEEASNSVVKPLFENLRKPDTKYGEYSIKPLYVAEDALLALAPDNRSVSSSYSDLKYDSSNEVEEVAPDIVFNRKRKTTSQSKTHSIPDDVSSHKDSKNRSKSFNSLLEPNEDLLTKEVNNDEDTSSHIPQYVLPDMRNLDSIMKDVQYKESRLAELLSYNEPSENGSSFSNLCVTSSNNSIFSELQHSEHSTNSNTDNNEKDVEDIFSNTESLNRYIDELFENHDYADTISTENESTEVLESHQSTEELESQVSEKEDIDVDAVASLIKTEPVEDISSQYDETDDEDQWKRHALPVVPKWLCATKNGLYCGGSKSAVYYANTKEGSLVWFKQNYQAIKLSVSIFGNILWKLDLGVAYAYVKAPPNSWKIAARNVESVAVSENAAWYVSNGNIYVQKNLSRDKPFNENHTKINCPKEISKVCCFGEAVWLLTLDGKILSKCQEANKDITWKFVAYPEGISIADFSLGCRSTGWIVDCNNDIYFTDNFASSECVDWWQIIIDNNASKSGSKLSAHFSKLVQWSKDKVISAVTSDETSVWINQNSDMLVKVNETIIEGHRWKHLPICELNFNPKWRYICASGLTEKTTSLWSLNNNDLSLFIPLNGMIRHIDSPTNDNIICLTALPRMLWVLSETGAIYVRSGIREENPYGSVWSEINFEDANDQQMKFKHLSLGVDVLWAVRTDGEIYAAIGQPCKLEADFFGLDWVHVTDPSSKGVVFNEVYVGSNTCMVWALDNKCNVCVRQAISKGFAFGTEWIFVSGIRAVHLAVSGKAVWALTAEGHVYKRFGISKMNYIGDYWLQIPGTLSLITASISEGLWGVLKSDYSFTQYGNYVLNLKENTERKKTVSECFDDWEIV